MFMAVETTVQLAIVGLFSTIVTAAGAIIISKLNSIHSLTNSNLSQANGRLDTALGEIKKLQDLLGQISKSVASGVNQMPVVPVMPVSPVFGPAKAGDTMEVKGTVQVQGTIPVEGEVSVPDGSAPKPKHK